MSNKKTVALTVIMSMILIGVIIMIWTGGLQDPGARLPALTGVYESREVIWLSSLFGNHIGKLAKDELSRP